MRPPHACFCAQNPLLMLQSAKTLVGTLSTKTQKMHSPADGLSLMAVQASVMHVPEAESCGNLVAHIKVPQVYNLEKSGIPVAPWVLFNDFAVQHIKPADAVSYDMDWKVPCVLYYTLRGGEGSKINSLAANIPAKQFKCE